MNSTRLNSGNDHGQPLCEIQGTIDRVVYTNADNGYVVFILQSPQIKDSITVQGNLPPVHPGELVTINGSWMIHPKFGKQFNAQNCRAHTPTSVVGLKKYLGSGLIKGIGPSYAEKLVDFFGENVLEVIDKSPEKLACVPGIGTKRCAAIVSGWQEQKEISHLMVFLQDKGISTAYATKIYKRYGAQTIDIVKENPYRLAQEVWGIGFKMADQLAKALGFTHESNERIAAGVLFALSTITSNGHLYCVRETLIEKTIELLELTNESSADDLQNTIIHLQATKKIHFVEHDEQVFIATASHYTNEKSCADRLLKLLEQPSGLTAFAIDQLYQKLRAPSDNSIALHEQQQEAILMCLQNKVSIITGGPGTGKTTIIKTLLHILDEQKIVYQLGAPTGRAAKRMMQATGRPAMTLHRLLEFDPHVMRFTRNEQNALAGKYIIVDEASMIDIFLANALLKAVHFSAHLLFIGDVDQLPSVGPGNFLSDMLASGVISHAKLTYIFRQAQDSLIVMNAHRVNNGEFPVLSLPDCKRDFFFIKEDLPENIPQHLEKIYHSYFPRCDIVPDQSIVLVPMNRGSAGTQKLNHDLQTILNANAPGATVSHAGTTYKVGDRVMQIRNNYDKLVFNGDVGTINDIIAADRAIIVLFAERLITYESNELDELTLAYAISIHKSQGSEYPAVIIPIFMQHFTLLARNLIYTALTRAKKICIFIGQSRALAIALRNNTGRERITFLKQFLNRAL